MKALEEDRDALDRLCLVSRERMDAERLVRFVLAPDKTVVPDLKRKLPGRGAHVALDRRSVDEAVRRKLFARAFKADVSADENLGALVDDLLAQAAVGSLAMARKAGELVSGHMKVDGAIRAGHALSLIHASDAAADGVRKIDQARRAARGDGHGRVETVFRQLDSRQLGLAIGGENVIHAAILDGRAGAAARKRLNALAIYRGENPEAAGKEAP